MRGEMALAAFFLLMAPFGSADRTSAGDDGITIPTGSIWTYDYDETVQIPTAANLAIDGWMTHRCHGLVNITVGNKTMSTVHFHSRVAAAVSGSMAQYNLLGERIWAEAYGIWDVSEDSYYDLNSGDLMRTISDSSLEITNGLEPTSTTILHYDERNETDYTLAIIEPADMWIRYSYGNLSPGITWSEDSYGHSNSSGVSGTEYYADSFEIHMRANYTFLGPERITVPAGTFECQKIMAEREGRTTYIWHSTEAKESARVQIETSTGFVHHFLRSYELDHETIGESNDHSYDSLMVLLAVISVATAVVIAVVVFFRTKGRPPAPHTVITGAGAGIERR